MNTKKYKITNTTVKIPKINPRTNKDIRSMTERVGYGVAIITDDNKRITLYQGRSTIVDHINEGMSGMLRSGDIAIEPIEDISSELKKYTLENQKTVLSSSEDAKMSDSIPHTSTDRIAKAVEMGVDNYDQKSGKEVEGATNPDGDPNFLVRADKNMKRKFKNDLGKPQGAAESEDAQ
jgi:hypothetical protein